MNVFRTNKIVYANLYRYSTASKLQSKPIISNEVSARQKLYITDPLSPGSIFFLPNGTKIFNKLITFMKLQQRRMDFKEVITPLIFKKSLWEKSGHWDNYENNMFKVDVVDSTKEIYGLKPMNCPGHCIIYNKFDHSYNELPIRYSDFSPLHRNEASGALSGLTRVRKFHQDDGHIFCAPEQVKSEISKCLKLIDLCYGKIFKFGNNSNAAPYTISLSTRPKDHFIGNIETWNYAEQILKDVLEASGKPWDLNEGDGAFYGPKLDIMVKDHTGKKHQVATIQLDFQLPERFNLRYKDRNNTLQTPIMIHRAVFGSLERFMSLLIDHYNGKWPFWLNPFQAMILPINTDNALQVDTCKQLHRRLRGNNEDNEVPVTPNSFQFDVDIDERSEPLGYRIKDAITRDYSFLIIIGENEVKNGKCSVRTRDDRTLNYLTADEIFETFSNLEKNYK
ncbi:hypothetical protein KAFR_0I00550 [Kazachstania africana CBS 2517]|uniref:threonine--tRNA ligase n=1 Tax=Kazachstania africana (strain ATCC 22294 / BCRC 22015 / CBS 2517 / CECT 1963 / NBRC 1671 / NRRL Y-8276) TaxID=1071382 RepID=H2AZN6_KAZAF|nr:hypothetical protein KAFR_0I00550 [Kazachstania africana CBS 2517]CCF59836.1 hypothetical protein KAFR_0I00550 [Kazachstania africana CBS 2517]